MLETIRIKDIGDVETGKTPPTEDSDNFGEEFPFITPADIREEKFILKTDRGLSPKGLKYSTKIPANAICVTCIGSTIGKLGITTKISSSNQQINSIIINENFDVNYCYYLLSHNVLYFKELAGVNAVPQLNKSDFKKVRILATRDIDEQKVIASILSKVDEAIKATENSIKAAEKLKKSLMQNLLNGKLKPDGTWRKEDEFYKDEKIGDVPLGWVIKRIDELVERKTDSFDPLKSNDVFDYIGLEHILQGQFIREGKGKSDETLALKVKFSKGDILLGKLRPYLNKVWISDLEGVGSTEFLVFQKNEYSNWVYLNFQSKKFLDYTQSVTAGTQHPRASYRDVKRFLVIVPSDLNERGFIENGIIGIEKMKNEKLNRILVLQRLKKSLMQNLLTGKMRVDMAKLESVLQLVTD